MKKREQIRNHSKKRTAVAKAEEDKDSVMLTETYQCA